MNNEVKLENGNVKEQIKYLSAMQGFTMVSLKERVNEKYRKTDSVRNLGNKLRNKTFRLSEFVEITDILGYDIYLKKRT
ncbi:MAG: LLM class flavin-dependent oxidoreductase [Candidatus Gastranaerophilales bacterium]